MLLTRFQGDNCGICESFRLEYLLIAHGCFSQGIVLLTVMENLSDTALQYCLSLGEATALVTNAKWLSKVGTLPIIQSFL